MGRDIVFGGSLLYILRSDRLCFLFLFLLLVLISKAFDGLFKKAKREAVSRISIEKAPTPGSFLVLLPRGT